MKVAKTIAVVSALAQPSRLAAFFLLARTDGEGLTAGDLAERARTPANTMSSHLTILSRAKLATWRRSARNVFYTADRTLFLAPSAFLASQSGRGG